MSQQPLNLTMPMQRVRIVDLSGDALNWAVELAQGFLFTHHGEGGWHVHALVGELPIEKWRIENYCKNAEQAYRIIKQAKIATRPCDYLGGWAMGKWSALPEFYQGWANNSGYWVFADSLFVAAMRAFVLSKLAVLDAIPQDVLCAEIEVPAMLLEVKPC